MALRRIKKELADITVGYEGMPQNCHVQPANDVNLYEWECTIEGPADSPYAGGVFFLNISFPMDYPYKPPKISFNTRIYHPNIGKGSTSGMCIPALKD